MQTPSFLLRTRPVAAFVLLTALTALQGCSTATRSPSAAGTPAPGASRTTPAQPPPTAAAPSTTPVQRDLAALSTERQWLQEWFKDTPVQIAQKSDTLSVDVPREFAFDAARSQVKAPLAAVLDKLAQSLRRLPQARLELVAAPGDGAAVSPLAVQRAAQVRRHLISRGVPAAQLGTPSATTVAAVQLRLEMPAP